jgi:Transglycosylase SLT domain
MRCRNLLVMIAAVAAWPVLSGPAAGAPIASKAKPRATTAQIVALIRRDSQNTEIVTFADRALAPVRVVRGKGKAAPVAHGSVAIGVFSAGNTSSVRVLRGKTAAAVVAAIPAPTQRAISGTTEIVSFADPQERPVTVLRGPAPAWPDANPFAVATSASFDLFPAASGADLDRIAFAVDGAESSHGADPAMWRPELAGPQGPMQVSAAAAIDSGGGDRFDLAQNRQLGRAYLGRLYRRYGNWPDAVAAYNWGPGNMDGWIAAGRPASGLPLEVERYRERVLREGVLLRMADQPLTSR